jgi:uncharacterized protein YkwD
VLTALVLGASTAAVTTVVAAPDLVPASPVGLSAQSVVIPAQAGREQPDAQAAESSSPSAERPAPPEQPTPASSTAPTSGGTRPPAPPAGTTDQVVALVNAERAEAGCGPLTTDARLTAAAQRHSDDMSARGYFSHTSQDGRTFADRIAAAGHPAPAAENIAAGQASAAAVMAAWMGSPGHRANILDCGHRGIGVGYAAKGRYWTQDFGR